ncbi:glucosamine-6-phosphate deaminase [Parapedobacter sp. DT-150]|uniref:glucosamine-6-phosphate deaminase n=1 Tax=Parapedobacter sp. DT-150 TaxID=3396162 RepID=UPI003F193FEF
MSSVFNTRFLHQQVGALEVNGFLTRKSMGEAAAAAVVSRITALFEQQDIINMVFAAAPSQNEFLEALTQAVGVDWSRINAFHMDEYIGLPEKAPQRFGNFLQERIFSKLPFRAVHYLDGNNPDPQKECLRYAGLLEQYPTDIVCMGIGENCHIAFNDPHVADFNDPDRVKVVDLDHECRQQQVNDGCFNAIGDVPNDALTLTIPALFNATYIFCMVPGVNKAKAIWHTLNADIADVYPSTILRSHANAVLFIDKDSSSQL